MFKYLRLVAVVFAVLTPGWVGANSFFLKEIIVIPVRPIDATTFEVIENDGAGGTQMWCAAGKFTRGYLRQRGGDLTVLTPRAASAVYAGRKSVIFTTRAVAGAVSSTSQGIRTAGQSFSMAHAYALCKSRREQFIKVRVLAPRN
ncbi:hypothetical protein [uncultured Tateyamaria sp.]|uniref:hypothetical protein n=1 Tax=uncultured Tateyamaria sp. TaxID=455651 RepID=UPI002611723A|nr:hypothetical protein [uncultured Tateyamaria sp.]